MKKLLIALYIALASLVALPAAAGASTYHSTYAAIYCYPTGSYWVTQRAAYPDYYAAYNAYYLAAYGPGSWYC